MIRLQVIGLPAPQGSKTRMPNGVMVDGTSKTGRANLTEWRRAVADAARSHMAEHEADRISGPCAVTLHFTFPRTASDPYRFWHRTKPDIDKVIRSTMDALVAGGLLADDSLVCQLDAHKSYGDMPGARITVSDLTVDEANLRAGAKARAAAARKQAS